MQLGPQQAEGAESKVMLEGSARGWGAGKQPLHLCDRRKAPWRQVGLRGGQS